MTDDNAMTPFSMREYQEFTPTTAIYDPKVELAYLIALIASEAGEMAGKYSKYLRDGGYNDLMNHLNLESGDLLWGLSQLFNYMGTSFEEVAENNKIKLLGRMQRGTISGSGDHR